MERAELTTARHTSEYRGRTVYFCAPGCKRAFDAAPDTFVVSGDEAAR